MRYSKSAGGFFAEELDYPKLPDDLVKVSDADYQAALRRHPLATLDVVNGKFIIHAPSTEESLSRERSLSVSKVSSACRLAIVGGFHSSALGAPHLYPSALTDQANLNASAFAATLKPDRVAACWYADAQGTWAPRSHTAEQVKQLYLDWIAVREKHQARSQQLQERIAKAKTAKAIQEIAWD